MDKKSKVYNFYLMSKGGWGVISGSSMEPILKKGWKIKIKPVVPHLEEIKMGDIVVFGQDLLTCHRVIGKVKFFNKTYFLHKGDNSSIGGIFESKYLIGKVERVYDEHEKEIDKENWNKWNFKDKKIIVYLYVVVYLIKRMVFQERRNTLTMFINRYFWKLLKHP